VKKVNELAPSLVNPGLVVVPGVAHRDARSSDSIADPGLVMCIRLLGEGINWEKQNVHDFEGHSDTLTSHFDSELTLERGQSCATWSPREL
jgi:hypothetical protein